jgi:predicted ATPase/DNA-binding CsgD family transcriptional regulator
MPLRGRSEAVAEVVRLLGHARCRLVTLTGLPGVGKSRLARHVADLPDLDVGPVATVDARQVLEHGLLAPAVAAALEGMPGLVVVDDVHRTPDAAQALSALLKSRPDLRLLVTARAPLHVPGERVVRLQPFADADPQAPTAGLARHPAVQLFLDVAAATGTTARMDGPALSDIAAVCARLGGLPLAIELAAARTAAFSPPTLRRLLERSSSREVLGCSSPDGGGDEPDLFGSIGWSLALLAAPERDLLQELTVFRSAVGVEAVEAVSGLSDVVERLSALVDVHLVDADHRSGASLFSLHPLVRERVRHELGAHGQARLRDLDRRHHLWAQDVATRSVVAEAGGRPTTARRLVQPVEVDLVTALHDALRSADSPAASTLCLALAPLWLNRGTHAAHVALLQRTRDLADRRGAAPGIRSQLRAWHALHRAESARHAEEVDSVLPDLDAAVALARTAAPDVLVGVLALAVRTSRSLHHREGIVPLCAEGLALARSLADTYNLTRFELWSGMLAHQEGRVDEALSWARAAHERALHLEDPALVVPTAGLLRTLPGGSDTGLPLPTADELVSGARRSGDRHTQAWVQPVAAMDALRAGDLPAAAVHCGEAVAMARAADVWGWCGAPLMCLAYVAQAHGDPVQAARFHGMTSVHLPVLRPSLPPWAAQRYDQALATFRASWEGELEAAYAAGAALGHAAAAQEAVAYTASIRPTAPEVPPAALEGTRHLTEREEQVLERLVAGESNKEISAALGITPKTVMHHTSSIYRKLDVRGRAQAVARQLRQTSRPAR